MKINFVTVSAVLIFLLLAVSAVSAAENGTDSIKISVTGDNVVVETPAAIKSDDGLTASGGIISAINNYNRAIDLANRGDLDKALEYLDRAIEINENLSIAYSAKAGVLLAKGEYEKALAAADKAIELNPKQGEAYVNKATVLNALGRYNEAIAACDAALALNLKDTETLLAAYTNKGTALGGLGRYEDEIAVSKEGLKIDPMNNLLLANLNYAENKVEKKQTSPVSAAVVVIGIIGAVLLALRRGNNN
ncbi:MAG: tetratricopeptide repeat protein [Methanomicrobium sp.]|nr:tetratricopeptide repeat protein [Methanomicrobium sp.]